MRKAVFVVSTAVLIGSGAATVAGAQMTPEESARMSSMQTDVSGQRKDAPKDKKADAKTKVSKADAKLINDTNASAKAKLDARDFAGAAADYEAAIQSAPNNPVRHVLYAGLGLSLRRQGVAAFNTGERETPPAPGSGNDVIRAFNARVIAAEAQRRSAAIPVLQRAMAASAQAATLCEGQTDRSADEAIGRELRETASLLYQIDPDGAGSTARPSAAVEAAWLRKWLAGPTPVSALDTARYGTPVALALTATDAAAGLTLADEVLAKSGGDLDARLGYARAVIAAKTPAGDPRRAKATAELTNAEATVTDPGKLERLKQLKAKLASGA